MNFSIHTPLKLGSILSLTLFLAACGGGSGGDHVNETPKNPPVTPVPNPEPEPTPNPQPEPTPNITYTYVKGTLNSFGDAFSHIDVQLEAKCLNQTGFKQTVKSDLFGEWMGEVDQRQLPCKIKAVTADDVYYSYLTAADETVQINPLSTYVIVQATKQLPEDWYASMDQLTSSQLNAANSTIRNELIVKQYDVESDLNILTSTYYDLLRDLKESVNKSQLFDGHQGLVKLLQQGKVSDIPFAPEDYARLNIDYSKCTGATEYQGNTALLTGCTQGLLPDFSSKKLVQENKSVCEISKQGENVLLKTEGKTYQVKLNAQANDKITDGYPIMNTLLLAEANQRVEFVFQYDLLVMAAAYKLDTNDDMVDKISCN